MMIKWKEIEGLHTISTQVEMLFLFDTNLSYDNQPLLQALRFFT